MKKSCRTCGQELRESILPDFTGISGTIQVSFTGVPALACPQGHEKKMIDSEFPSHILANIMADIPWSIEKGLVLKEFFCRKCKSALPTEADKAEPFKLWIPWRSGGFDAVVTGPGVKCGTCGTFQMPKTKQLRLKDIPNAIVDAFDSIHLKR